MNRVIIKRYPNRKLYVAKGNTEKAGYITLNQLVDIVKKGKIVRVVDARNGDDITVKTLKAAISCVELNEQQLLDVIRSQMGNYFDFYVVTLVGGLSGSILNYSIDSVRDVYSDLDTNVHYDISICTYKLTII